MKHLNHTAFVLATLTRSHHMRCDMLRLVLRTYPFLKPAYGRWDRRSKMLPKGENCFDVGPARDHRRDCHRVLTRAALIQEGRNVNWEALPSRLPPPQPRLPIEIAEEGGEESDDDVEVEVWPLEGRGVTRVRLYGRSRVEVLHTCVCSVRRPWST